MRATTRLDVDPVDDRLDVDLGDERLHVDPFDHSLDVDLVDDRLDVDALDDLVDIDGSDHPGRDLAGDGLDDLGRTVDQRVDQSAPVPSLATALAPRHGYVIPAR